MAGDRLIVLGYKSRKGRAAVAMASLAVVGVVASGCGRAATDREVGSGGTNSSSAPATSSTSAAATGDFGSVKSVCAPGSASGGSARGLSGNTIRIGVLADPGSTVTPGLGQEFFDVADVFTKWCNAAGGINGRKIVVDKLDAKLFNVGQVMSQGCQKDFMLVGNGNAFDSAGVGIREKCGLGQIPAYVVSPQAVDAKLQVQSTPIPSNEINDGAMRLLAEAFPATKTGGVGIAGSTLASLIPTGLKAQEYLQDVGIKVAVLQQQPVQVDNYRPYIEQLKQKGAAGLYQVTAQDATPIVQAMKNVGYNPAWALYSTQFYGPQAAAAAKAL